METKLLKIFLEQISKFSQQVSSGFFCYIEKEFDENYF